MRSPSSWRLLQLNGKGVPDNFSFSPHKYLGFVCRNSLVHLALVSLILHPHNSCLKKGKRRKYLTKKQKIPEEISHLQTEGKPGKPAKEQNELGKVTGKPVL